MPDKTESLRRAVFLRHDGHAVFMPPLDVRGPCRWNPPGGVKHCGSANLPGRRSNRVGGTPGAEGFFEVAAPLVDAVVGWRRLLSVAARCELSNCGIETDDDN